MRTPATLALAATAGILLSTTAFAQSRDFDLANFDRVDIATGLDARITQGQSIAVKATSNSQDALDNLVLDVQGGVLTARFEQSFLDFIVSGGLVGMLLRSGNVVTVDITVPTLTGVSASSGADVDILSFTAEKMTLDASSGANIAADNSAFGRLIVSASSGGGDG